MNQSITVIEAIAISVAVTLGWAFIKTVLETIEENGKEREKNPMKRKGRTIIK